MNRCHGLLGPQNGSDLPSALGLVNIYNILSVQNGFKKTSRFQTGGISSKAAGMGGYHPTQNGSFFKNQKTKPSQMINDHVQSLKQCDIRCSRGVGVIRN